MKVATDKGPKTVTFNELYLMHVDLVARATLRPQLAILIKYDVPPVASSNSPSSSHTSQLHTDSVDSTGNSLLQDILHGITALFI